MGTITQETKPEVTRDDLNIIGFTNHQWAELTRETAINLRERYKLSDERNRDITEATVAKYKRDMEENNWNQEIDLDAILIDEDFNLRGGQHRIKAFIDSGLPKLKFPIVYPASEEEIARQDTNKPRTLANSNEMVMSKSIYDTITTFECLAPRTVHSASKVLAIADEHPGKKDNGRSKVEAKVTPHTADAIVKTMENYLSAFIAIDEFAFPQGKVDKAINMAGFAPFVAAYCKAYPKMDRAIWRKFACLLTDQNYSNIFDKVKEKNSWLAAQTLVDVVFGNKKAANNPRTSDLDMRKVLSCLAAAHEDANIKVQDLEWFGYETFIK